MAAQPRPDVSTLSALAELVDSQEPRVREFLAEALAESERLTRAVHAAEDRCASVEAHAFLDGGHRDRLEDLILRQEADVARLTAIVERARALGELARWSADTTGSHDRVTVEVDDLMAALADDRSGAGTGR